MQKVDVEVSGTCVEVMVPYLNPEHKRFSRHGGDGVGSGIVGTGGGETGVDDNFFKGVDDFVVEGDKKQDDDADGKYASKDGSVFRFFSIPE